ncbi:MAG: YraN family protein [Clostridia bacterium]|nr:YraN family protein [Clostridia bacterium]
MDRISLGKKAEELAAAYLLEQGYRIIERNFRCSFGEMDIIAEDADVLVFVEVRSKQSSFFGLPQETVTWVKQQKLRRLAGYYLKIKTAGDKKCRFDVIGILFDQEKGIKSLELIKDAF